MDSLTQLTLGAAVAEVVAGKKLGNKAMLWGAIAGTIPDLDVISNLWLDDIDGMAFHRGITHSIFFTIVGSALFSAICHYFYRTEIHNSGTYKVVSKWLWTALLVLFSGIFVYALIEFPSWPVFISAAVAWTMSLYWGRRVFTSDTSYDQVNFMTWYWLFFWAFATHIMIDAFTTYGTQILQPFDNLRFTTSSISVVDMVYTIPLLLGLLIANYFPRKSKQRIIAIWAGILVSSIYMAFTFINKSQINKKFETRLAQENISYTRYLSNPTIFNNVLWHAIAETDDGFYEGYYSMFDEVRPFDELRYVPKNSSFIENSSCHNSRQIEILKWFSDGYYNLTKKEGELFYNDLRFGGIWSEDPNEETQQVFYYLIDQNSCQAKEQNNVEEAREADFFKDLWTRIKGIKK